MLRLAYLVSQFPETHESFIVREVQAIASHPDVELTIFSLKHCRDRIIQEEAKPFLGRTHYPTAGASARSLGLFLSSPEALGCLAEVIREYRTRPWAIVKAAGTLMRAAAIEPALRRLGNPHVHAHWATMPALAAYFLKRAAGFRYSLAAHAWDIYADTTMLKAKIEAAEFVVTCTRANREHLEAISGNATPIVVSYHGLDFERVSSPRFDRAGELSILAVGRLVEQKGFRHLVEACALLATKGRTFRCRIIGDGPLRSSLQREIQDRGLNDVVTLSGPSPLPEVFDAYRKATLLCVPSVVASDGDRDGIPNVIIEAMSQGLPVVASRVSGIPEVVREGETGWLLPPGDAAALAEACDAVAKGAPEAARRAAAAHAFVRREFDVTTNTAPLLDLFRKTGSAQERIARLS